MIRSLNQPALGDTDPVGTPPPRATTCANGQALNEARADWRARVKRIAKAAAGSLHGIAAALRPAGIQDDHARKLVNEADPLPLVLGDVMAGDPEWAAIVLDECLEVLRGRAPVSTASLESIQRKASSNVGAFAQQLDRALHDGVVSRDEAKALLHIARQARRGWDDAITKLEGLV